MNTSTFALVASRKVSVLLALAGGYLDGFTYVGHGHVFANAMTGNVVLLGINLLTGTPQTAFRHLPPILAFLLGIGAALSIQRHMRVRHGRTHYGTILAVEIAIFLAISFLPQRAGDFLVTTSVAFAASLQVATFREVNGKSYNSTFTTGNLRTLSEAIFAWVFEGRSDSSLAIVKDFSAICLAFLLGAIAGGAATTLLGNHALWLEITLLSIVAFLIRRHGGSDMIVHQER